MSAVIKNPGQLWMMCYKVEIVLSVEAWYFARDDVRCVQPFLLPCPVVEDTDG